MPKKQFDVVVLDVDGTTVASGQHSMPSPAVIAAVKAASKKAHVALATGRPFEFAEAVIRALGLTGPGVMNGGAEIVDMSTGEILQKQYLSIDAIKEIISLGAPFGYAMYTEEDNYTVPMTSPDQVTQTAPKIFIDSIKPADVVHMLEAFSAVEDAVAHPTTSWGKGDVVDIHLVHPDGTKRHGVERLIKLLGGHKDRVLAIGDSHNDLPLLEAAGFKVAMGNAAEEVKAVADYVTASQEDDGVAEALKKFIVEEEA